MEDKKKKTFPIPPKKFINIPSQNGQIKHATTYLPLNIQLVHVYLGDLTERPVNIYLSTFCVFCKAS